MPWLLLLLYLLVGLTSLRYRHIYHLPLWTSYCLLSWLFDLYWLLYPPSPSTFGQLRPLIPTILGSTARCLVTLEAIRFLLLNSTSGDRINRHRGKAAILLGVGLSCLLVLAPTSLLGNIRIGCVVSLTSAILIKLCLRNHFAYRFYWLHAGLMCCWLGTSAFASAYAPPVSKMVWDRMNERQKREVRRRFEIAQEIDQVVVALTLSGWVFLFRTRFR